MWIWYIYDVETRFVCWIRTKFWLSTFIFICTQHMNYSISNWTLAFKKINNPDLPFLWRTKHKKNNLQLTCKLALRQLRTTAWRSSRLVVRSPSRRLSNSPPLYCSCLVCFLPSVWKNTRLNVSCNYTTKVCFYVASNKAVVIQNGRVARNTCVNIYPQGLGVHKRNNSKIVPIVAIVFVARNVLKIAWFG